MFDVLSLTKATLEYSEANRLGLGFGQCQRIVLKVVRRMEREATRLNEVWAVAPDSYKTLSYSDPTGEAAVEAAMKEIRRALVR